MTYEHWPTVAQWVTAVLSAVATACFTTWLIGRYFLRTQWPRRDAWKENNWVDRRFNDNVVPRGDIDEIDPDWWRGRDVDNIKGDE